MDELVLDELPDDPCHLVSVQLNNRIFYLDFRHGNASGFLGVGV
jgi:hypothetical protein